MSTEVNVKPTTANSRASSYKKACDAVLLSRSATKKEHRTVKLQDGSSLAFFMDLIKSNK